MQKITNWENIEKLSRAVSTVMAVGEVVAYDGAGALVPATTADAVVGLLLEANTAADVDFAVARKVHVEIPSKNEDLYKVTVINGPLVEGELYDVDAADASQVDGGAAGTQFQAVTIIDATTAEVRFA